MNAALLTELMKFTRATVPRATTVIMVLGIAVICSSMLLAVNSADPQLVAKLGPVIDPGGWAGYFGAAAQVTGAAALLGYGVVLGWTFGREFTDGTVTGLFALPVSRATIAAAKFVVYGVWAGATSALVLVALLLSGFVFGLGPLSDDVAPAMARQFSLGVLTAAIATPVAAAATLGRSALAGIATTVIILTVSQVAVVVGAGGWFPFSAPALWAVSAGTAVSAFQLALVFPLVLLSCSVAVIAWRRLQLDR